MTSSPLRPRAPELTSQKNGVFPIEHIYQAIEYAKFSTQQRVPHGRQDGPYKMRHPSTKCRQSSSERYDNGISKTLEGTLESDYCLLLEFDPSVEAYSCQPFKLTFGSDEELTSFTPDMVIYPYYDRPFLVDCKTDLKASSKRTKRRHERLQAFLAQYQIELKVILESQIRVKPRIDIYSYLYRNLAHPLEGLESDLDNIIQALAKIGGRTTVCQLRELGVQRVRRATAYGLATGALKSDLRKPYGPDFIIYL